MDEINKPLLVERGRREREMVSVDLSSEGSTTTMHEGYEVQKKYLVPDSNLLEMKKLVELKLKGDPIKPGYTGSPHYKRPKYSIDEDDNLTGDDLYSIDRKSVEDPKKGEKQDRVTRVLFDESTFEDETDILENKGYISNNDVKEPGDNILEDESRDDKLGSDKHSKSNTSIKTDEFEVDPEIKTVPTHEDADKRSKPNTSIKTDEFEVDPEVDTVPTHKDSENKRFSTPIKNYDNSQFESKDSNLPYKREIHKKKEVFEPYSDNYKPRILLSGHLRKNFKPIFIIHKYSGESLFGEKSPDFLDSKIESEVELFISGKFYKHSILEELNGYPNSLLINKRRIPIGDGCKVFEDSVYQMFGIGDIGVELEAKFIKAAHLRKYTPFLTLKVHRLTSLEPNSISGSSGSINKPLITLDRQLTYYVQKPESKNVFNTDQQNQKEDKLEQDSILDSRGSIRNPFITLDRQLAYYVQNTNTKQTFNIDSQKQRSSMKCKDCSIKSVPSFVFRNFQNHEITVNYQTTTALDGERHSEHENNFEMNQSREQIYCDSCLREMRAKAASCEGRGEDKQKCLNDLETVSNIDQQSKSGSSIKEPFKNVEKSDFDYLGRSENEKSVQAKDSQTDITLSVKSLSVSSSLQPAKKEQGAVQKCFPVLEYKCEVRNKKYRNVVRNAKKVSLLQTFCRALGRGKQKKCSARKKKKTVKLEIRNDFEEDAEVNKSHEYRCIVRPKKSRSQNDSSVLSKINKWFCQNK